MIQEIRQSMIDVLNEMNWDVDDASGDTVLGKEGLDLDSLAVAELAVRMEDTYSVKLPQDEMERFAQMTLNDFAEEVYSRVQLLETASEAK
ncbi:MAG TPA: acyl carrier protein [Micromonosporaceae bacterium]|nr:acyl carrier protein [Micromonosporaceae bacterium]